MFRALAFVIRSDEGLTFGNPLRWPVYIINSVDKPKMILLYSPTDAAPQFLLEQPPLFTNPENGCLWKDISKVL